MKITEQLQKLKENEINRFKKECEELTNSNLCIEEKRGFQLRACNDPRCLDHYKRNIK